MKVVVTGASGNVGTALLKRLQLDGPFELHGVSRRPPPGTFPYRGVRWHAVDLGDPRCVADLVRVFDGADAVIHLAWLIQPSHERDVLRRVNQGGTRAVLDAALQAAVPHLVHASSVGAYSPRPGQWADESWHTGGIATSSYSVDKAACERMIDEVEDRLTVTRMRPAIVLHNEAASEISRYFLGRLAPIRLLRSPLLRVAPFPRDLRVQFVHAEDVADAIALFLRERPAGGVNLALDPVIDRARFAATFGGVGPSLPVSALRRAADLTWRAHLQPTDAGWVDLAAGVPIMRTDRARSLGWQPQHAADAVLAGFVGALSAGRGGPGPLLYPRRMGRHLSAATHPG